MDGVHLAPNSMESVAGDAVVLATGGYANVFYLSTNAISSNASAIWRAYRKGADVIAELIGVLS